MNDLGDPLLELLVDADAISREQLEEVKEEHARAGTIIRDCVIDLDIVSEEQLLRLVADHFGIEVVDLASMEIPREVLKAIPPSAARMYTVVPIEMGPDFVVLATSELVGPEKMDELMFVLTRDVRLVMAPEQAVKDLITQYYGDDSQSVTDMIKSLENEIEGVAFGEADEEADAEELAGSTPVIRMVNLILYQAVQDRASDIHFEPFESNFQVRYRVDGALYEMPPPPPRLALAIISRLKVMAQLNIAERRLPQDGRIQMPVGGKVIDFRVSCLPTQFGESVVLRVLDRAVVSLDLENLGFPEHIYEGFTRDIVSPNGIVIVTGPTGSGKTTTLYSALRRINDVGLKLLTVEDPVEYDIDGIIQVPINDAVGRTFALVLRAFLRQDPDVMMIGELRDLETSQIAIQSSLTGHLVFSTLHTNDAPGAITRLIDMNVEPYLISSTLQTVLGQRLVRQVCSGCKEAYDPTADDLAALGLTAAEVGDRPFYIGHGCEKCHGTGYRGRHAIYEYLLITDPIRVLINERQPTHVIRQKAVELGMTTLREDGIRNILDGYTTLDEVTRYT